MFMSPQYLPTLPKSKKSSSQNNAMHPEATAHIRER